MTASSDVNGAEKKVGEGKSAAPCCHPDCKAPARWELKPETKDPYDATLSCDDCLSWFFETSSTPWHVVGPFPNDKGSERPIYAGKCAL
jgi:hypothetical protein